MSPDPSASPCPVPDLASAVSRVVARITSAGSEAGMLAGVLDEFLDLFACDRAWLLEPVVEGGVYRVAAERTRPRWPGALAQGEQVPIVPEARALVDAVLADKGPVSLAAGPLDEQFGVRSKLVMAIRPRPDEVWMLGIHHCETLHTYAEAGPVFCALAAPLSVALRAFRAADELRQSEERFRALVEHAPEAIVILDAETARFINVNPGAEALYGLSREDLVDLRGPLDLSPACQPDGRSSAEAEAEVIGEALAGGFPVFEWMHLNAAGEEIPCEIGLARLPHPERRLVRGAMVDIRGRKKAEKERRDLEAQLVQSQKLEAVGQLTGGVAHDFNNLLTVILGNVEMARQFADDAELVDSSLEQVDAAAGKASALTQRLLAFARRQPLQPRAVDVARLLADMEPLLSRTLGEQVSLRLDVAPDLQMCEADPAQLESALLNLCLNARDALPDGGTLEVGARNVVLDAHAAAAVADARPGAYIEMFVRDHGVGMAPDLLANIFEPFFTTKEVGRGSGLGLSMVYGFVKQSGGHVRVDSTPGRGTTVTLVLPQAAENTPAVGSERPAGPVDAGRGETILVVEDADDVRTLSRLMLHKLGYQVLEAPDAAAALALIGEGRAVDLLFSDVVLPGGMNGVELADRVRGQRPGLPVLLTSGYTADAVIRGGRVDPAVDLLEKPFTREALARRVRLALDNAE